MKIFISYCWDDENIVIPIINKFVKKYNLSDNEYFLDRRVNVLGDHYWENIDKSIKESTHFIYFNSINYYNSSSCSKEYLRALFLHKLNKIKILEVRIEKTDLFIPRNDLIYIQIDNPNIIDEIYKSMTKTNVNFKSALNNSELSDKEIDKVGKCIYDFIGKYDCFMKEFSKYFQKRSDDLYFSRLRPTDTERFASETLNDWIKQTLIFEYKFDDDEQKALIKKYAESNIEFDFRHFLRKIGFEVKWGI